MDPTCGRLFFLVDGVKCGYSRHGVSSGLGEMNSEAVTGSTTGARATPEPGVREWYHARGETLCPRSQSEEGRHEICIRDGSLFRENSAGKLGFYQTERTFAAPGEGS
jgi:hypothetical protein